MADIIIDIRVVYQLLKPLQDRILFIQQFYFTTDKALSVASFVS